LRRLPDPVEVRVLEMEVAQKQPSHCSG
jgi:hypothetical protein